MDETRIEITEGARDKLVDYFKENPEASSVRIFLQQGG